ncbi:RHS repeat domain-containing protein [Cohnella yongneupensis]|uniref:RHS repeat domain-containing protein n=1 Tax=Cohnella yongneupensis TaxID=425006 RepID=A0ABW0QZI6_9BACL
MIKFKRSLIALLAFVLFYTSVAPNLVVAEQMPSSAFDEDYIPYDGPPVPNDPVALPDSQPTFKEIAGLKQTIDPFGNTPTEDADPAQSVDVAKDKAKAVKYKDKIKSSLKAPKERVKKVKSDFTPAMKLLTAYYNPTYYSLLTEDEQKELIGWDTDKVNKEMAKLKTKQLDELESVAPAAVESYDYRVSRSKYIDKHPILYDQADEEKDREAARADGEKLKKAKDKMSGIAATSSKLEVQALAAPSSYKVTEFKNKYTYKSNTDDLVDETYRTANHSVTDLSLPGKKGLDIVLSRSYSSLSSKILNPEYTALLDSATNTYAQDQGNLGRAPTLTDMKGFIATGWTLSLPSMEKADVQAEIQNYRVSESCSGGYNGTNVCYKDGYALIPLATPYEKVSFSLDDGSSYEFRNGQVFDYPYQNVSYNKALNATTSKYEYSITVDGQITYKFDDQGNIISKKNEFGDQVTYVYTPTAITITDSYGRVVTISRDSTTQRITGIKAVDGTATIRDIQYNATQMNSSVTYRKWTASGYQNVTENLSYWQLNGVTDVQAAKSLETYTYYTVDSTKLADFNYKADGYTYWSTPNGDPSRSVYVSSFDTWSDNQYYDLSNIRLNNASTYGEIPYLLIKNINYFDGLTVQFNYQNYSPSWYTQSTWQAQEDARGTTRMYQDDFAIQYFSYHAVDRVDYIYTQDSVNKQISDYYYNLHTDHGYNLKEYWKTDKNGIPRLRQSSRFGDKQTIKKAELNADGTSYNYTYSHYINNGKSFVKAFDWTEVSGLNAWNYTYQNVQYNQKPHEVTAYEYEPGQKLPRATHTFSGTITDLQNPSLPVVGNRITKQTSTNSFDSWGYVASDTDLLGNVTIYEYSGPFHQISKKTFTAQDGSSIKTDIYTYYASNDADPLKRNLLWKQTTTTQYKDPTDPTKTKTESTTTEYTQYDSQHLPKQVIDSGTGDQYSQDPLTTITSYVNTVRGQIDIETTLVKLGQDQTQTSLSVDYDYDIRGNVLKTTYPDGSFESETYDYLDRVKTSQFNPAPSSGGATARLTSIDYNDSERSVTVTTPDGEIQKTFYTPFGLDVKSQRTVNGTTRIMQVNTTADGMNVLQSLPYNESDFAKTYAYDSKSRVKATTDKSGTTYAYYTNNSLNSQPGGYDYWSESSSTIAPDGNQTIRIEDAYGRTIREIEQNPDASKVVTTAYTYNATGQMMDKKESTSSGIQMTSFGYDGAGNLIYLKDHIGQVYRFVYNRSGQMLAFTINGKLQKSKSYNELGWLLTATNQEGKVEKTYYTNTGLTERFTDKMGQNRYYQYTPYYEVDKLSVKNASNQEIYWSKYTYNPNTRLLESVTTSTNESQSYHYDQWKRKDTETVAGRTFGMEYDAYDRLQKITYPDNKKVEYGYDWLNRITSVKYPDFGATPVNYNYTIASNQNNEAVQFPNGVKQETKRDAFMELQTHTISANSVTNWAETFSYDGFGNIKTIDRVRGGVSDHAEFKYDGVNRIRQEDKGTEQKKYTYSDLGDRLTMETSEEPIATSGQERYSYDALNQLKTYSDSKGTSASYTYYGDGKRATRTVNGVTTRYIYVNGKLLEELDGQGNLIARNVWGNDLVYRQDLSSGKAGYYQYNGHGDVVQITNATGATLNSYDYDVWGNITSKSETMSNPFKYTGEVYDDESSLYYLSARYYNPRLGRFINEDTYEGQIDNPLTLNLFTYVENNPLINVDPTGHWSLKGAFKAAAKVAKVVYDAAIGDDIRTLTSSNASFGAKLMAGVSIASNFIPGGGTVAKVGVKLVEKEVAHVVEKKVVSEVASKGGRLGNQVTREQNREIAQKLESKGWEVTHGAGKKEEYLPGPNGTKGSNYPDITATKNGKTLRINTVDTRSNGQMTTREANNLNSIRQKTSGIGSKTFAIPKKK